MAYKEIREEFPTIPMIVICDEDDNFLDKYHGSRPMTLFKPIKVKEIIEKIDEAIISGVSEDSTKRRILAVDDNGAVLRNIKSLVGNDYSLTFATSGEKALQLLEESKYDLVLLDYEMPGKSGYDVFKAMKVQSETRDIPVVFLTGVSDKQKVVEIVSLKPEGYLLKPIDEKLLHETLDRIFN